MKATGFDIVEQEVDSWRLKIYERIKDMTFEERSEYFRKRGDELAKKYGYKRVKNAITMEVVQ